MITSLGIDLSSSATGIVLLEERVKGPPLLLLEQEIKGAGGGAARNRDIAIQVMTVVADRKPDKIVIEGYSLSFKNAASVVPLVELGGVIRLMLHLDGRSWLDPRASQVKKFVTGKGNSPKDKMMLEVYKRWGHSCMTNNTADAFGCATMGLAAVNKLQDVTLDMRKIAGALKTTAI